MRRILEYVVMSGLTMFLAMILQCYVKLPFEAWAALGALMLFSGTLGIVCYDTGKEDGRCR